MRVNKNNLSPALLELYKKALRFKRIREDFEFILKWRYSGDKAAFKEAMHAIDGLTEEELMIADRVAR